MSRRSNAVVLIVIGAIFVAPLIYNTAELNDNALNWVIVFLGACLLTIGVKRLRKLRSENRTIPPAAVLKVESGRPTAVATPNPEAEAVPPPNKLALFFKGMGHLACAITLLATLFLLVFMPVGGASGVPIAVGLMVAGMFYGLSSLASK